MGILEDSLGGNEGNQVVQLENLVDVGGQKVSVPQSAVRNRAATTALLSPDPSQAIDNYHLMMNEAQDGTDEMLKTLQKKTVEQVQPQDMQGLLSVLSDPNVPLDQKQSAVKVVRNSQFLQEPSNTLFSNTLQKASKGETVDNEEARINTADAIKEIWQARREMQAIVNRQAANMEIRGTGRDFGEVASLYGVPFANNISKGRTLNQIAENAGADTPAWSKVLNYLQPGTGIQNVRQHLENLPPAEKVKFQQAIVDAIGSSSHIIFHGDNQFAQYDAAQAMLEPGGYSSPQKWMDNIAGLLDIVGLGAAVRDAGKANSAAKAARASQAARDTYYSAEAEAAADYGRARRPGSANPGVSDAENVVHKADWELVNDPTAPPSRQLPEFTKKLPYDEGPPLLEGPRKKAYEDTHDAVRRIEMNGMKATENPASPAKIIQQSNPEQARNIHKAVVISKDDSVAEAMYGTSKMDAIIGDVYPQIATESGAVTTKVANIDREVYVDPAIKNEIHNDGAIYFSDEERQRGAANIAHRFNDFASSEGLAINDAMTHFSVDGGRTTIHGVYGAGDGAFSNAADAFEQAKVALRGFGVQDHEITILEKQGLDHVPVKLEDVKDKPGNYLVRVDYTTDIRPSDVGGLDHLDVKRNWLDRIPELVTKDTGSASRYLFDASSMLHDRLTGAAVVASDKTSRFEKHMLGLASEFSDKYMKLKGSQKRMLDNYIRHANYNGIKFDPLQMHADGHSQEAIDAVRSWRNYWDTHYYLENYDLVRTLDNQNYHIINTQQGDKLVARPIAKDSTIGKVYDPAVGDIIAFEKVAHDTLYANGGTAARLRRPIEINGKSTEYMVVRNTPTEYLRKLRDSDHVLNYREGYFQIQYKAPKFVIEVTTSPNGIKTEKAIAVAGDTPEAQRFATRMSQNNPDKEYKVRGDDRAMRKDSDAHWDINSASGRIAQRIRGKLLEDGSGMNHLGSNANYIVNPVDSAVRAARSISGRTVSRPMLEAYAERLMQQDGHMYPPDGMGGRRLPKSTKEIDLKGELHSKELADARTRFEYFHYLQNGYINSMDNVAKSIFRSIADMSGKAGLGKVERGANLIAEKNLSSALKGGVFLSYIGANPLRQILIQPHQAVRMWGYNPRGWLNGEIPALVAGFSGELMGVRSSKYSAAFRKFVEESGMLDAVDKENLIRGTLLQAADTTNKFTNAAKAPLDVARKVGFDIGEMSNLLVHAAAVYERRTREGINLADKTMRDRAYSEIRALSYDMNFAGDMVYNQTSPAALLQFLQVPHKAVLQLTNRRLSVADRLRLGAFDIMLWGPPTALISAMTGMDLLPDHEGFNKDYLRFGAEAWAYNELFSELSGERQHIDFSSLAPYEMTGWTKFAKEMWSGGGLAMITNSPSGQLYLKEGGRVRSAIAMIGRYFGAFEDLGDDKPSAMMVLKEVAKISSGFSNAQKAYYMLEGKKAIDKKGGVTDQDVTELEAYFQAIGFGPRDVADAYESATAANDKLKDQKKEVLQTYNAIKQYYKDYLQSDKADPVFMTKVSGYMLNRYANNPVALQIIRDQIKSDMNGQDASLANLLVKAAGIPDKKGMHDAVSIAPLPEDQKQKIREYIDNMKAKQTKKDK